MKNITKRKIDDFFIILNEKKIYPVFQPIVSLEDGEIAGYEALSRIDDPESSLNTEELFSVAEQLGYLWKLEKTCRKAAVKAAAHKPKDKKLFLNVDSNIILDEDFVSGFTKEYLHAHNLKTKDVVFEITERHGVENIELFQQTMKHYESQGFAIAIDDLGSQYSGLNRINYLNPQYIKIDIALIRNIHNSKSQRSLVSMLVRHCNDMGYTLVAEGIETPQELECLHKLGVHYGQGYYLARPDKNFVELNPDAKKQLAELNQNAKKERKNNKISALSKMGWILDPACQATYAYELFLKYDELSQISIVDAKNHFHGLLMRDAFMNHFQDKRSIPADSPITDWMDESPLTLDANDSLKTAVLQTMTRPTEKCYEPFVILKNDRYHGIGTIHDLLLLLAKKQAIIG
ncbi:MAG: EAL domain-containing protein [Lachnospiraceae bacterium]|nr:EAL domain-containing protein [Lachnospiraceae bacterium]